MSADIKEHERENFERTQQNHQHATQNLQAKVTTNTMTSTDSSLFDGAKNTKNDGDPTHKNLKYCRKELVAIFATVNCTIDEAKNRGHSFLAYTNLHGLAKTNITATVPIPVHPGEFKGSTHAEKYKHEQKFKQYTIFRMVDKAGVQLLQTIYNTTCFVDGL